MRGIRRNSSRAFGGAAALALSLAVVAPAQQAQQDTAPMTEAQIDAEVVRYGAGGKRLKAVLAVLNSADYATIRAYFEAHSEIATGQDYFDYMQKHVFAPAGATSASFPLLPKNGVAVVPMAYPYDFTSSKGALKDFDNTPRRLSYPQRRSAFIPPRSPSWARRLTATGSSRDHISAVLSSDTTAVRLASAPNSES